MIPTPCLFSTDSIKNDLPRAEKLNSIFLEPKNNVKGIKMIEEQEIRLNDLPSEMIAKVFEQLDVKTLLESSLVCKRWNEIIGHDVTIIKKIKLHLNVLPSDNQMLPEQITRNYQTIKISGNSKSKDEWQMILMALKKNSHLQNLETNNCIIKKKNTKNFNELLASMTKLETLTVLDLKSLCYSQYEVSMSIDLTQLNNLKNLLLFSRIVILKFPESAQLTSLHLHGLDDFKPSELISFLADQNSLKNLSIEKCKAIHSLINLEKLKAIQFPLKRLSICKYDWLGSENNLLLFMRKFANSLELIHTGDVFPASMYEMIFNEFRKLIVLLVCIHDAPNDIAFYRNLRPNLSVKNFIARGDMDDLTSIKGLIGKLPNLQTLDLSDSILSKELMMSIASNLTQLKVLQVFNISDQTFEGVNIPSLKKVTIMLLDRIKQKHWKQIVRALPNIVEFEVKRFARDEILNEKIVEIISEGWPQLKRVELGKGPFALKDDRTLFITCKDLKIVEIFERAFKSISGKEEILRHIKQKGFSFVIKN